MKIHPVNHENASEVWTAWQSKSVAQRRVDEAFRYTSFATAPHRTTCCVIHPHKTATHRHHLDESGDEVPEGWFFENLVPVCANENLEIEQSRRLGEGLETHEDLSPDALRKCSGGHHKRGRLLFAYACARLGAFLSSPLRPTDRGDVKRKNLTVDDCPETIEFATSSLFSLRGVPPKYGVPLATDTLKRSVLNHIGFKEFTRPTAEMIFSLVVALGAFHRDYGDIPLALRCMSLARRLADAAGLTDKNHKYVQFINHVRILHAGMYDTKVSDHLGEWLASKTKYADNMHGELNLHQWQQRLLSRSSEAECFLEGVRDLEKKYLTSGSFVSIDLKLKKPLQLSAWDHFALLTRIGDAYDVLGNTRRSDEVMRMACQLHGGAFGVNYLGRLQVFRKLAKRYERDTGFHFPMLDPRLLDYPCRRTFAERKAYKFSTLSRSLLKRIECWYENRPRIVLAGPGFSLG